MVPAYQIDFGRSSLITENIDLLSIPVKLDLFNNVESLDLHYTDFNSLLKTLIIFTKMPAITDISEYIQIYPKMGKNATRYCKKLFWRNNF